MPFKNLLFSLPLEILSVSWKYGDVFEIDMYDIDIKYSHQIVHLRTHTYTRTIRMHVVKSESKEMHDRN